MKPKKRKIRLHKFEPYRPNVEIKKWCIEAALRCTIKR